MTLQWNIFWQHSGTFPTKLREIVYGFVDKVINSSMSVQNITTEFCWLATLLCKHQPNLAWEHKTV